jgi:transmembrane sensor
MTKEEVQKLAGKIVIGTATQEEMLQYIRICDLAETVVGNKLIISAEEKDDLERNLRKSIFQKVRIEKVYRVNWIRRTVVAASVLLVIGLGWLLLVNNKPETAVSRNTMKGPDSLTFTVRHEVNTSGKEKRIQLTDGSLIILADKSEVTYRQPFINTRNITLVGKAYFSVAKDKTMPFTVTSGGISTTALGTAFTVTAFKFANEIIVRLHKGKVVVKTLGISNRSIKDVVYLLPGQELMFGGKTKKATVKKFAASENGVTAQKILAEEVQHDNPAIPQNQEGSWYMFNNQTLDRVLNDLAGLYGVEISYNRSDIQNIYFTCKYKNSEPVEAILERIGRIHQLTVSKKDAVFYIHK